MTVRITIDGRPTEVEKGHSLWESARTLGIEIPTLCHHPDLPAVGSCRLCVVEIAGWPAPVCSCVTEATDGLAIVTDSPDLREGRRQILEMLLADFTGDVTTDEFARTEFGRWCRQYDVLRPGWGRSERRFPVDSDPNPFIRVDFNECILCTRCVRACDDVQGRFVWGVAERSRETRIVAGADTTMLDARCESCGACAEYCPTNALTDRVSFAAPPSDCTTPTTCTYCGVGCQLGLDVRKERVVAVSTLPDAEPNGHSLCVKGRYGFDFIHHPDRLSQPRVREYLLKGESRPIGGERGDWVEVEWDTALRLGVEQLCRIRHESGGDAIGLFSSAKCTNEENYLMQKLARQVLGTNNIDHCARLCHASTVAGLSMCFGSGAMSNSMDDIVEQAEALFIIGSNTTEQHPVFGAQLRQCVRQRGVPLVVADPRRIDIAEFATVHLRQRPGTDIALINGLMHIILENHWHDVSFIDLRCEDFVPFEENLSKYDAASVSRLTGVSEGELHQAAEILACNKPMAVIWAMGITQHTTGVLNVLSLGNLQMLLGNMGVPGGGVNPLRGQNNVQGACDMGALPNVFSGYQPVTDSEVRKKFESAWALDGRLSLPEQPGLTITEMIERSGTGDVRALYIVGENPAMTDPDSNHVQKCLSRCEFVLLQEIFPSETSQFADVLLPGTSFAEREGTFTNTDRRVQRVRQAIEPIAAARPDWQIIAEIGERCLQQRKESPTGPHAGWDDLTPQRLMEEIAELTPSYGGITYARLDRGERLQWPVLSESHPGTPVLHVGRFTRGLGKFHAVDHLPPHELPDVEFPLLLTTGRVLHHWHGGEMTRRSPGLNSIVPGPLLEVSPSDAARMRIANGDRVRAFSRRGEMQATALVTDRVPPGVVFGNFHFPGLGNVNNMTIAALDPIAKIPEYKVCAVRIESHVSMDDR